MVEAGIAGHPEQPLAMSLRVAQGIDLGPGLEEDLLSEILGLDKVSGVAQADPENRLLVFKNSPEERFFIHGGPGHFAILLDRLDAEGRILWP
jgi:hypothetical protein